MVEFSKTSLPHSASNVPFHSPPTALHPVLSGIFGAEKTPKISGAISWQTKNSPSPKHFLSAISAQRFSPRRLHKTFESPRLPVQRQAPMRLVTIICPTWSLTRAQFGASAMPSKWFTNLGWPWPAPVWGFSFCLHTGVECCLKVLQSVTTCMILQPPIKHVNFLQNIQTPLRKLLVLLSFVVLWNLPGLPFSQRNAASLQK